MTQRCIYWRISELFGNLRSCRERAVRGKETKEDLNNVYRSPTGYVHSDVGLIGVEESKIRHRRPNHPNRITSGEAKSRRLGR